MQDRSYGMGFEVTALELRILCCDDEAEEPGSHAVIVSEVIEMLAAKSKGFGYQASILVLLLAIKLLLLLAFLTGDLDASEDSSGEGCHCVEMKSSLRLLRGRTIYM